MNLIVKDLKHFIFCDLHRFGFKLVNDGDISLGDLTAFQSYVFQIGVSNLEQHCDRHRYISFVQMLKLLSS